ncbi:hypothetical protein V6R86_05110 [Sphingomonas kaistensis]|uniref:AI-2E family transporter n=1 Tax=Sphingomonas kaistensis TaxID=298708 RepID=A0ABZ2FZ20_9SPHN
MTEALAHLRATVKEITMFALGFLAGLISAPFVGLAVFAVINAILKNTPAPRNGKGTLMQRLIWPSN